MNCKNKPILESNFTTCHVERKLYKRTLVYHPSNSKLGIVIKGTNLRVSFKYL